MTTTPARILSSWQPVMRPATSSIHHPVHRVTADGSASVAKIAPPSTLEAAAAPPVLPLGDAATNSQPALRAQAQVGDTGLYQLLTWTSPSYPTGAFSYSHGLEWAVECGDVHDAKTLVEYIDAVLSRGGGWIDAVLFARAYACAHESASFDEIAELAAAFRGSRETALESQQQGAAFLLVTRKAWPHPLLDGFAARHGDQPVAHSIAMALACAAHGVPVETALTAWLHSTAANLVSAGVRLVPLGQTDGQIATAQLAPRIGVIVRAALVTSLDELGTATPLLERCSIQHETQYTRLFRS